MAELTGDAEDEECVLDEEDLACCAIEQSEEQRELPTPRDDDQRADLDCSDQEEMENWPRHVIARRNDSGSMELHLYRPQGRPRLRSFNRRDFARYLGCTNRQTVIGNSATWGQSQQVDVPCCTLTQSNGRTETNFNADTTTARWTWTAFNLHGSQPNWLPYLRRSLMFFPIEHLRAVNPRTLFFDFYVGTSYLGTEITGGRGLATGGCNWATGHDRADSSRLPALGATFAALNRLWATSNPRNDAAIDSNFTAAAWQGRPGQPARVLYTLFHEFGHLVINSSTIGGPIRRQAELWGQYRDAIEYAGNSQDYGEGFCEAYWRRLYGLPCTGARSLRATSGETAAARTARETRVAVARRAEQALDQLGMPTRASCAAARTAIMNHEAE